MASLDSVQRGEILRHLNEVAPDTYDEGEDGPYRFTDVTREGSEWRVHYTNADGENTIGFTFDGDYLVDGLVDSAWHDAFHAAFYDPGGDDDPWAD